MIRVTVDEAKEQLSDLVEAALRGEAVFIDVRNGHGERTIQLTTVVSGRPERGFGSMRGTFTIAENFDDPLDDFADYQ